MPSKEGISIGNRYTPCVILTPLEGNNKTGGNTRAYTCNRVPRIFAQLSKKNVFAVYGEEGLKKVAARLSPVLKS